MWRTTLDLRELARRQRWMRWVLLLVGIVYVSPCLPLPLFVRQVMPGEGTMLPLVGASHVMASIVVVLLLSAQGNHILMIIACGVLTWAPCANLALLLLVHMSVTRTLRRTFLHVDLLGVKKEDMERLLNSELCLGCGYDLTGNVSGRCPECGRAIQDA